MPPCLRKKEKKTNQPADTKGRALSKYTRGKRGLLDDLPNQPLDIVYEILSRCSPLDLLRLARTTKAFRTLLMSRSSIAIWKSARELSSDPQVIGMPDPPPYLSEPALANLAFDPHCHSCMASNIHGIIWEFCKRYCIKCKGFTMMRVVDFPKPEDKEYGAHRVYRDDSKEWLFGHSTKYYHKPEITRFHKALAAMTTEEERAAFIKKEREFTKLVAKHAKLQREWDTSRPTRSDEIGATRDRMVTSIIARLKSHGWEDELQYIGNERQLLRIPCLNTARDITDRIWMNIEPVLMQYMEDHKTARLERDRQALLVDRFRLMEQTIAPSLSALSKTIMIPHIIDICLMDDVRSIIDVPAATTLTATDFTPLITLLPTLAQRWRTDIESRYIQHVSSNEHTVASDSAFELVTRCKRCRNTLFYPDALSHECHNLPRGRRKQDQPKYKKTRTWQELRDIQNGFDLIRRLPLYERATRDLSRYVPWSCDQDSFEEETALVRKIIEACGELHNDITCTEMDNLDTRLSCDVCSQDGRMLIVTWRSAIDHALSFHPVSCEQRDLTWSMVNGDGEAKARELESSIGCNPRPDSEDWCCSVCKHHFNVPNYGPWAEEVCWRLSYGHGISPPELRFYRPLSSTKFVIPPVILLSDNLSVDDLSPLEKIALRDGRAAFITLPA